MNPKVLATINLTMFYGLCVFGVLIGNTIIDMVCLVGATTATVIYFKWIYE
jgi:hypothetical protein